MLQFRHNRDTPAGARRSRTRILRAVRSKQISTPTRTANRRRIAIRIAIITAFALVLVIGGHFAGSELPEFEAWIKSLGGLGALLFVVLFVLLTGLQMPESLLAIAAGVAFGLWEGFALVVAANLIGATVWFWFARELFRERFNALLRRHQKLLRIERATEEEGFRLMLLLRLGPFSYGMMNLILGASRVRFRAYAASMIGVIPGNFATVYFGATASHVAKRAAHADNLDDQHFIITIVGFLITVLVVAIIARAARRALRELPD